MSTAHSAMFKLFAGLSDEVAGEVTNEADLEPCLRSGAVRLRDAHVGPRREAELLGGITGVD
ncbi:MAG: hypothetical protein J2P29_15750, partial [Actinobacteria bacterium]|nr:hypothetical protein [Actinomycetota bacterium]